jgi:hypothetical protein
MRSQMEKLIHPAILVGALGLLSIVAGQGRDRTIGVAAVDHGRRDRVVGDQLAWLR